MNQDILERFVRVIAGNSLADTKADRRITVSVTVYTRHMVYSFILAFRDDRQFTIFQIAQAGYTVLLVCAQ